MNLEKDTWKIIDIYFRDNKNYLTKHQLDSFNNFITKQIPETIKQNNPVRVLKDQQGKNGIYKKRIDIYFGGLDGTNIYIGAPIDNKKPLYPNEARLKNLNYASEIYCDILIQYTIIEGGAERTKEILLDRVLIGRIPIMLHSNYCVLYNQRPKTLEIMGESPYEQGGYFIIDGKEKTVLAQEQMAINILYLSVLKNSNDWSHKVDISSKLENTNVAPKTISVKIAQKNHTRLEPESIHIYVPYIRKEVPLFILMRALGIESDREIIKYIVYDIDQPISEKMMDILHSIILEVQVLINMQFREEMQFLIVVVR